MVVSWTYAFAADDLKRAGTAKSALFSALQMVLGEADFSFTKEKGGPPAVLPAASWPGGEGGSSGGGASAAAVAYETVRRRRERNEPVVPL